MSNSIPANRCDLIYIERRPRGIVGAAPLIPDRTICNPINDFKLGGVALIDTSLSFVVSDMLNPLQQSSLNAALTQAGFFRRKKKRSVHQQHSHEH